MSNHICRAARKRKAEEPGASADSIDTGTADCCNAARDEKKLGMSLTRIVAGLFGLAVALAAGPAQAAASPWQENDQGAVRLVSAVAAVGDGAEVQLGLHFRLKPGWKVYWRSPGDAGYPPSVDWQGSTNLRAAELRWPLPHRFEVLGLQTVGYKDEVVLPVTARLAEPGGPLALRGSVDYLVCDAVCIPQQATLALSLPAGPATPSRFAHDINRFAAAVPGDGARHGLSLLSVETAGEGDAAVLRVAVRGAERFEKPDLFVEDPDGRQFGPPRVTLAEGGRRAVLEVSAVPGTVEGSLVGVPLTVTAGEGGRGLEAVVEPVAGALPASGAGTLLAMLGTAIVGGLILNLMPCVLPVLSLKILGLVGHGGGERRRVRLSFVASSAGIVASFLALATAAVAVKAAGAAVGWGIQFQQPLFLVALTVILTLFAANLWGFFEISLPHWMSGLGRGHGAPHSLGGHFVTGAFATLLATPCTAPFLGTAVGFALARGPVEIFAIFTALGIGMALPYLLVAAWPQLALRLPRPGRWMVVVKQVMGVALAATAVWLLAVLASQTGTGTAVLVGGMMAALAALLALRLRVAGTARPALAAAVVAIAGLAFVVPFQATSTSLPSAAKDALWRPFDRDAIAALVADGRTVFVDVTADWCITCQVNKTAVINRGGVAERLGNSDVVAMRADWTRPDDGIAHYLASYGRYGIPFNVVYGPGAPGGVVLPELLTESAVLKAFEKAAGKSD